MKNENKQLKTGTTTVAIVCKDGVVLAADKRATAGYIANKRVRKVLKITDNIAITTAGTVSDIQLLSKLLAAEITLKDIQTHRQISIKEAANLLGGLVYSNFRKMSMITGVTGFLLAGHDDSGEYLYEIGIDGSLFQVDDYASDGSGSVFAIGALETLYKPNLSVEDGVKLAIRTINTAIQRDIYSGNGINVVTVTSKGARDVVEQIVETKLEL